MTTTLVDQNDSLFEGLVHQVLAKRSPTSHEIRTTFVFSLPWLHLHRGDNALLLVVILVKIQVTVHCFVNCTVQVAVCEHVNIQVSSWLGPFIYLNYYVYCIFIWINLLHATSTFSHSSLEVCTWYILSQSGHWYATIMILWKNCPKLKTSDVLNLPIYSDAIQPIRFLIRVTTNSDLLCSAVAAGRPLALTSS